MTRWQERSDCEVRESPGFIRGENVKILAVAAVLVSECCDRSLLGDL